VSFEVKVVLENEIDSSCRWSAFFFAINSFYKTICISENVFVAKRGRPKSKMQLNIGSDPGLCRFESVSEAISASTDILAQLIRQGERQRAQANPAGALQVEEEFVGGD
jgi:hypothetical protein